MARPRRPAPLAAAALLAAALAPAAVRGDAISQAEQHVVECCNPDRCRGALTVQHNNLGGLGPDGGREVLRYGGVPAGCDASGNPRQVDLIVTAAEGYETRRPYRNGLHGEMMRVGVRGGGQARLHLELRTPLGEPVEAEELVLHVFDLDEGPSRKSRTGVSARRFESFYVSSSNELHKTVMGNGNTWFVSQSHSEQDDAPRDFRYISQSQLDKSVSFRYVHRSSVDVTFKMTTGDIDHDFIFAVKLCTKCGNTQDAVAGGPVEEDGPWQVADSQACKGQEMEWAHCEGLPDCHHCLPQDCQFAVWGQWYDAGGCTGLCFRHREEARPNNECGRPCDGLLMETKECQKEECMPKEPRDGRLSPWSQWSICQNHQRQRTRQVAVFPRNGGRPTEGALTEMSPCEGEEPKDCMLSQWSVWTTCSVSCGDGWHNRMRRILQFSDENGRPCEGSLRQMRPCKVVECSGQDCLFGAWSSWEGCSAQRPLQRFRSRLVARDAAGGGAPCGGRVREAEPCSSPGPLDCAFSPWDDWTSCDRSCGGGQTYRKRHVESSPSNHGICPSSSLRQAVPCNTQSCLEVRDCQVSEWSLWSECSAQCSGIHKRDRKIIRRASAAGRGCHFPLEEVASCSQEGASCEGATDCKWADWNSWSACTCSCGGGTKRRNRHIAVAPRNGGQLCGVNNKSEVVPCNTEPCDEQCIDGLWGQWSNWGECSTTCGQGFRWRHRDVAQQSNLCGRPAVGRGQDWKLCAAAASRGTQADACGNRDCVLSPWNQWSDCSCTCFGVRERQRVVAQFHSGVGKACFGRSLKEVFPCNPGPSEEAPLVCRSPKRDCMLGQWSEWTACSVTCGGGNHERSRHILHPASNEGAPCTGNLKQTQPCAAVPCSEEQCVDCVWGAWSDWGACTKCGDQRYRHRGIERLPNHCGKRCAAQSAKQVSNCTSECHKTFFCSLRPWSAWSGCSADCGSATRMRQRSLSLSTQRPSEGMLFTLGNYGGGSATCSGMQVDSEQCTFRSCLPGCVPQACEFQPWSDWQAPTCTGLCERARVISRMNNECGPPCNGALVETKRCLRECTKAQDCVFSAWHPWSHPDAEGSTGQLFRTRSVVQVAKNGGTPCDGPLQQTISDDLHSLQPRPCLVGVWGDWSACSKTCGSGWTERSRSLEHIAEPGAKPCDVILAEGQNCSLQTCGDADCELGPWGAWSGCTSKGQQFRRREVEREASGSGRPCGSSGMEGDVTAVPLGETRPCGPIRTDCTVSQWTAWDDCDKSCGGGEQQRHRQVEVYPVHGGAECPESLHEMQGCNLKPCADQDCLVGSWTEWGACSASCGNGQQQRHREMIQRPLGPGKACQGAMSETRACLDPAGGPNPSCGQTDCQWGEWSDWSGCSCSCSGGQRNRARHIARAPRDGGAMCEALPKEEVEPCNTQPCHMEQCIDGRWGPWEEWNQCTKSCGGGVTWRHRSLEGEASECGRPALGLSMDTRSCNAEVSCEKDVDCQWSSWSPWSGCTRTCDGVKRRSRRIAVNGRGNGAWCLGAAKETSPCNPVTGEPAPPGCHEAVSMDCLLGVWGEWSRCDVTCGGGQIRRERSIMQEARHGGKGCSGDLAETQTCSTDPCPALQERVDCQWGEWSSWGACSKCGGQRTRFRHVLREPRNGGAPCRAGAAEEMGKCPRQCEEKLYCVWAEWGPYSQCTETCGHSGKRSRRRHLVLKTAAELKDLDLFYEDRAQVAGQSTAVPFAHFLSQGLRLEVLAAFLCGCLGRAALATAGRAWERRRHGAPGAGAREALTPRPDRQNLGEGGWSLHWPSGLFGGWPSSNAARRGYLPVSQAAGAADTEA